MTSVLVLLLSWSVHLDGIISVTYDGVNDITLRMSDANRAAFLHRVVDRWEPVFGPIADEAGVPRSQPAAIIWQESGGDEHAQNKGDGGKGLMQITGALQTGAGDLFDPTANIRRGVALLKTLNGYTRDWPAIAAMYNAGSPAILGDKWVPPGTPGSVPSMRPWTNEAWEMNHRKTIFESHWGFCTSPGYIDSVVAAQNEYIIHTQGRT